MTEIWKSLEKIIECGNYYKISNFGNVKSIDRIDSNNRKRKSQIIKQWYDKDGYCRVSLRFNKKKKNYQIHRLVAMAFIENLENKPQVNHKDGNKKNNNVSNLEWMTNSENQQHAYETGLRKGVQGESNHNSRLTDKNVISLFNDYKTNRYSMQDLADKYNSSLSVVHGIVNGESWKHLNLGVHKRDMSKKSIITKTLISKVKKLHNKGYSKRKIEREIGVSRTTVTKILNK